jgi:hypothetical protein
MTGTDMKKKDKKSGHHKSYRKSPAAYSRREAEVQEALKQIFPEEEAIYNGYYSWLIGSKGYPMQLDIYYPRLQLVVEVDGIQHQQFSSKYHRSRSRFEYMKECDRLKEAICKERGMIFIRIRPGSKVDRHSIKRRLKKAGLFKRLPPGTIVCP